MRKPIVNKSYICKNSMNFPYCQILRVSLLFKKKNFQRVLSQSTLKIDKFEELSDVVCEKKINFHPIHYSLEIYHRSNQDTCLAHRPAVSEGDWVEKGDLLADCIASLGGELSLGRNILIAYMPWEGYNYEDAILISERLVYDEIYTSIHIERYETEIRETKYGKEKITKEIPDVDENDIKHLDSYGVCKIGTLIEEGAILVGKITPISQQNQSPYQKLLYTLLEKKFIPYRENCLRAPKGVEAKVIDIHFFEKPKENQSILINSKTEHDNESSIDSFSFSKNLELQQNINQSNKKKRNSIEKTKQSKTKKMPFLIESKQDFFQHSMNKFGINRLFNKLFIDIKKIYLIDFFDLLQRIQSSNLKSQLFFKTTEFLNQSLNTSLNIFSTNFMKDFVSKLTNKSHFNNFHVFRRQFLFSNLSRKENIGKNLSDILSNLFLNFYFLQKTQNVKNKKIIDLLKNTKIRKINKKIQISKFNIKKIKNTKSAYFDNFSDSLSHIHIHLAEKRKLQVGDKMSGRHGNKGIVSQILPRQDMPYLPDGTPIDMVLNPLGVPSRMNVGQIYECLLGLAGFHLGAQFRIFPFDEIYGPEASRSFVFSKLYEASKKTGMEWLFDPNFPGKTRLFDGRTGECFDQPVTVGYSYILKLVHLVDDKMHSRSTGPYSLVTQQPVRGRSKEGGQRLGEMEVWALEGYGAAFILLEMLTTKSDNISGRLTLWSNLLLNRKILLGTPESFKVLVSELQSLCLSIGLYS